jgi:hypothetical protein
MSALAPYQDPALPTNEEMVNFTNPVAEMTAQPPPLPPRQPKGFSFDFDGLIGKLQADGFDSLSPAQQELLWSMKDGVQYSPAEMASFVQNYNTKVAEQSTPQAKAQAEAAQLSARKTQLDIGKLEQETIAKAKEQAELNTRKQLVLEKINKYTNPQAPNFTDISPLVGKFDGTAGAMLDAVGANDQRSAQRAELERLVNTDVLELTKFLKPVSQDELKFLKSMTPRLHQNDTIWREYLLDAKSRIEGMGGPTSAPQTASPQAAPAQPQQPAPQNIRKTPAGDLIQLPNGKYYPAQFYRP